MKGFFCHLFLPQETNNYRPKIIHHSSLLFLIILLFLFSLYAPFLKKSYSGVLGVSIGISSQDLLLLTNKKRQQNGLSSLKLNAELNQAASLKGTDMFAKNYWAHSSPSGTTPWFFIKKAGYKYVYAGENLARGFTSSEDVINAWMDSKSHRENILSKNFQDVGFAVVDGILDGEVTILVIEELGGMNPIVLDRKSAFNESVAKQNKAVEGVKSSSIIKAPILDTLSFSKILGYGIFLFFIFIFALDMIIIENKKIIRFVGHNSDHILFLGLMLLFIVIISKGVVF